MSTAKTFLIALAVSGLAACTYPTENVEVTDERPAVAFRSAPAGSQVFVDGVAMGPADKFDGKKNVLQIEPGTHVVQVRQGGQVLFSQTVFLGARATKTFIVP